MRRELGRGGEERVREERGMWSGQLPVSGEINVRKAVALSGEGGD